MPKMTRHRIRTSVTEMLSVCDIASGSFHSFMYRPKAIVILAPNLCKTIL